MSDTALNWGLNIAIGIVILGVTLEGAEFAEEIHKRGWQFRNCLKLAAKFGFALLVLGLCGEWYFSTAIHNRDADTISGQQSKIIGLEGKLLEAVKQAANRSLSPDEIKAIGAKLLPFKGENVEVIADPAFFERTFIGGQIMAAVSTGGWGLLNGAPVAPDKTPDGNISRFQGIGVMSTSDKRSVLAAHALYEALPTRLAGGLATGDLKGMNVPFPENPRVIVFVGDKKAPLYDWVK